MESSWPLLDGIVLFFCPGLLIKWGFLLPDLVQLFHQPNVLFLHFPIPRYFASVIGLGGMSMFMLLLCMTSKNIRMTPPSKGYLVHPSQMYLIVTFMLHITYSISDGPLHAKIFLFLNNIIPKKEQKNHKTPQKHFFTSLQLSKWTFSFIFVQLCIFSFHSD